MSAAHTTLIFEKVVLGNIAPCIFFARRNVPFSIALKVKDAIIKNRCETGSKYRGSCYEEWRILEEMTVFLDREGKPVVSTITSE